MGVGEDHGGGDGGGVVGAEGARGVAGTLAGGAVGPEDRGWVRGALKTPESHRRRELYSVRLVC